MERPGLPGCFCPAQPPPLTHPLQNFLSCLLWPLLSSPSPSPVAEEGPILGLRKAMSPESLNESTSTSFSKLGPQVSRGLLSAINMVTGCRRHFAR